MTEISTTKELLELLKSIEMLGTRFESWRFQWDIKLAQDEDQRGWNIRCSFERPDVNTPGSGVQHGFGRKWFIGIGTPATGVVFTAWLAIKQVAEHELMESFTVKIGEERVRLLDPHKTLEHLAVGSRRVDR